MRIAIPSASVLGGNINTDLFRTIIADWLDANPEDSFRAENDMDIDYLLSTYFPTHVAETSDMVWTGFWDGFLPGAAQGETGETLELVCSNGVVVLDSEALDRLADHLVERLWSRLERAKALDPSQDTRNGVNA